jgi:hypothetical protein
MRARQCVPFTICIVLGVQAGSQHDAAMSEVQPAAAAKHCCNRLRLASKVGLAEFGVYKQAFKLAHVRCN